MAKPEPEVQIKPILGSSNVAAAGYHGPTRTLHVVFHSGGHYTYHNVAPALYERFLKSESKGNFLHKHVKGRHRFSKLL